LYTIDHARAAQLPVNSSYAERMSCHAMSSLSDVIDMNLAGVMSYLLCTVAGSVTVTVFFKFLSYLQKLCFVGIVVAASKKLQILNILDAGTH
jgi:hypothetical protein